MLFLCFVLLVCFSLYCVKDDSDYECMLHHEPVLCNLPVKETIDTERVFKVQNTLKGEYFLFLFVCFVLIVTVLSSDCDLHLYLTLFTIRS